MRSLRRLEGSLHLTTSMFDKQGKYREHSIQLQSTTAARLEIVYVSSRSCCLFTLEWAVRSLGMVLLADKELQPVNTSNTVSVEISLLRHGSLMGRQMAGSAPATGSYVRRRKLWPCPHQLPDLQRARSTVRQLLYY